MNLFGANLLNNQDWAVEDINALLDLAEEMRNARFSPEFTRILENRIFYMFFFAPSLRTRLSFCSAAAELGGQAIEVDPGASRFGVKDYWREAVEDVSRVLSLYGAGVGIRVHDDSVQAYAEGAAFIKEFSSFSQVPVISMGDDKYHPCQGLADLMGLRQSLGRELKGKKILITWARGELARSRYSTQEILLVSSRAGMDVTLAYPVGYDLDPEIVRVVQGNCSDSDANFRIIHDATEGYRDADVVYSRNWVTPFAYSEGVFEKEAEIKRAMSKGHQNWICTEENMRTTRNGIFMNPMPVDRGNEVTNEVASGPRSIIYDVAENRLHTQKALMALTMNQAFSEEWMRRQM